MGQTCRINSQSIKSPLELVSSKVIATRPNMPKGEFHYITCRPETSETQNDFDIGTVKSTKKKEVRFLNSHSVDSQFMKGVQHQKKKMLQQIKMNNQNQIKFLFEKKDYKLIKSNRDDRQLQYDERRNNNLGDRQYLSNRSIISPSQWSRSQSPNQKSILKHTITEMSPNQMEVRSVRSLNHSQTINQGILKMSGRVNRKKNISKSLYGSRTGRQVRFQF